jgi:pSer/pThr/pTyr-binding forkhead associated (FHA) protein
MSAVLLVTNARKQASKVPVPGSAFTVGRSRHCDLPLDEPLASRQHVEITQERGVFWIRDCGTRNGTSLNGKKLADRCPLKDGDEIAIGATRLKFLQDENDGLALDEEATRAADPADQEPAVGAPESAPKKQKGSLRVTVRVIEGPAKGAVFRDFDGPLTIGRAVDNHVVLLDDRVSSHHARIVQEDGSFVLENLSQHNPTFLDKVVVQRATLADGQKINLAGAATLSFEVVDLQKRRRALTIASASILGMGVLLLGLKLLLPPDIAGRHVDQARVLSRSGQLLKAKAEYEAALKVDPTRSEAQQELRRLDQTLEAQERLKQAEAETAAGNFEKARDLVNDVLRSLPDNPRALELKEVINLMEDAKTAFDNRNWTAAVAQLQKAQDSYPNSQVISARLKEARSELDATQHLAGAKDALQQKQLDIAEGRLNQISSNSVYWAEAAKYLQQINIERLSAKGVETAQGLYRAGRLSEALAALDPVLTASPESPKARDLQERYRRMTVLLEPLKQAEGLAVGAVTNADALIPARNACTDVLDLEPDPLNELRKKAQATRDQIEERLRTQAQANATEAVQLISEVPAFNVADPEALLKKENLDQAEKLNSAWKLLTRALLADERNQTALQATNALHEKIVMVSKALYTHGLQLEDLEGSAKYGDTPKACFRAVTRIGLPGEHYYESAKKKLR